MAKTKTEHKLWIYVAGAMAVVAVLWALVFYPHSLKKYSATANNGFAGFKSQVSGALSIFKKSPAPAAANAAEDIDSLRERVFGDSTKK